MDIKNSTARQEDALQEEKKSLKVKNSKIEDLPGQQMSVYSEETDEEVQEVVDELNPELDSLGYRG